MDNNDEDQSSITPKRPLLFRDRSPSTFIEVSPLSDRNSRPEQPKRVPIPASPLATVTNDQSPVAVVENCMFIISPPQPNRTTIIDDDDDNSYVPAYIHRKAKVAPSTTWKISYPLHKLSGTSKTTIETPESVFDPLQGQFFFFFFNRKKQHLFSLKLQPSHFNPLFDHVFHSISHLLTLLINKHMLIPSGSMHYLHQLNFFVIQQPINPFQLKARSKH